MILELKQVLAIEGRSCMRRDIARAERLAARRIESVQLLSGGKPDLPAGYVTPLTRSMPGKGPYSRTISAFECCMRPH